MEQNTTTQVEFSSNVPFSSDLIPDMPPGPLDKYRKSASFNWKVLRILLEKEELLAIKNKIWRTLESEREFHPPKTTPSCDEQKRRTSKMLMRLHTLKHSFLNPEVTQEPYKRKVRRKIKDLNLLFLIFNLIFFFPDKENNDNERGFSAIQPELICQICFGSYAF